MKSNLNPQRTWADLKDEEKEFAKDKYMAYQSIISIANELNIPRTTIQYHANKYWDLEREMLKSELYTQFSKTKKALFVEMSEKAMKIINKSMSHLIHREAPPTTREAKDATAMLEALDKITRLDDGKPTEILEEKVMALEDIKKISDLIPFKKPDVIIIKEEKEDDEAN